MHAKLLLVTVAVVLLAGGCAVRAPAPRAELPPCEPVSAPSSTPAVPVTLPDTTEYSVWDDSRGEGNEVVTFYDSDGRITSRHWKWGYRLVTFQHYDRRGRIQFTTTNALVGVADLSNNRPEEFDRWTWSPELMAVYIVGNRRVTDADILTLYEDPRVKYMIVERCRRVSRATLREIESKLVSDWPEDLFD
jgi:hypothetical protein